jgi:hypothetical protein
MYEEDLRVNVDWADDGMLSYIIMFKLKIIFKM